MFGKKKMACVSAALFAIVSVGSAAMLACSAEETENAYLYLRSVSEDVWYDSPSGTVNTISDGVTTASVTEDGSYQVSVDVSKEDAIDAIDEISILQLYVDVTDDAADVSIQVDALKIDGEEVSLAQDPECTLSDSGESYYVDLCNTNGENLFDRKDYQDITTIEVDFTVTGWPVAEEETTEEETTAAQEETEEEETTTQAAAEDSSTDQSSSAKTGDVSAAAIAAIAGLLTVSAVGVCLTKKK